MKKEKEKEKKKEKIKYIVEVEYIKVLRRTIEADDKEEALKKAEEDWNNGKNFEEVDVNGKFRFSIVE